MGIILSIGLLIFCGYILGELADKIRLPKISGYILSGILLNPDLFGILPYDFVNKTDNLLSITLSLIVFSIGGTLSIKKIKETGRTIISLTAFESLFAFIFVFVMVFLTLHYFLSLSGSFPVSVAVSFVLASLAAPTDPSATIAVIHEYKAKGIVSSSMLGIAAFDDVAGIIIYTIAIAFSSSVIGSYSFETTQVLWGLTAKIAGSVLIGLVIGFIFKYITQIFRKKSEGSLIVIVLGMILLGFGISHSLEFDPLLTSMTLGAVVINTNSFSEKIFSLLERYTDELIFVIFFALSGLHLQLSSIGGSILIMIVYVLARILGKLTGIYTGASILKTDLKIKKYTAWGLFPQGGIVIGLALLLKDNPEFSEHAPTIIGIVIGSALIHEILGPIISKISLKKAGEIQQDL